MGKDYTDKVLVWNNPKTGHVATSHMSEDERAKALIQTNIAGDVEFEIAGKTIKLNKTLELLESDESYEKRKRGYSGNPDDFAIIDKAGVPKDHTLRNAWKLEDGKIEIDKAKAVEIIAKRKLPEIEAAKRKLIEEANELAALGDDPEKLETVRQKIRDLKELPDKLAGELAMLSLEEMEAYRVDD